MSTESNPLRDALAGHADALIPGGAQQLEQLWGSELANTPPSAIREVVDARINRAEWSHFRRDGKPAAAAPPPAPAADAPNPLPAFGRQGYAIAEAQGRMDAGIKSVVEASRANAAPGLAGNYQV